MDNPYRSPTETQGGTTSSPTQPFWWRFSLLFVLMVGVNFCRLALTWRAFGTDGYEQIGFPFVAFERGGFSYSQTLHWHWLAVNVALAIGVAYGGSHLLRDGWYAAFRKIQTWRQDVT